jgi:hypothetical protein
VRQRPPEAGERASAQAVIGQSIGAALAELGRADGKAGILLGWAAAAVALVTAAATSRRFGVGSASLLWISDALLAVVIALLLAAVRPNLRTKTGWMRYAAMDPAAIVEAAGFDGSPEAEALRLKDLAQIAYGKYVRLRLAVDLVYAAGVFLVTGLLLARV